MAKNQRVISSWHRLIDDFHTSSTDFYAALEDAVKDREIPEVTTKRILYSEGGFAAANREYLRVQQGKVVFDVCAAPYGRGFFFSWWLARLGPEHPVLWFLGITVGIPVLFASSLWLTRGSCGGLFLTLLVLPALLLGVAFLVRKGEIPIEDDLLGTPVVGWVWEKVFSTYSYYREDTAIMFREHVKSAVAEVVASSLSGQGVRARCSEEMLSR